MGFFVLIFAMIFHLSLGKVSYSQLSSVPCTTCDCNKIQEDVAKILTHVTQASGPAHLDTDPNWKKAAGFVPTVSAARLAAIQAVGERPEPPTINRTLPEIAELHAPVLLVKCVENCGDNADDKFIRYDYVGDLSFLRQPVEDHVPPRAAEPTRCPSTAPAGDDLRCLSSANPEVPRSLSVGQAPLTTFESSLGIVFAAPAGATGGNLWTDKSVTDGSLTLELGFCALVSASSARLRFVGGGPSFSLLVNGEEFTFTAKPFVDSSGATTSFFDVFVVYEHLFPADQGLLTSICVDQRSYKFLELCLSDDTMFTTTALLLPAVQKVRASKREHSFHERSVFGTDTRTLVNPTTSYPNRVIAGFRSPGGTAAWCSGAKVGPRHVLTAGHCLYDDEENAWILGTELAFGQNGNGVGASQLPYGLRKVIYYYSVKGWVDYEDWNYDYGMVIVNDSQEVASLGWLGYSSKSERSAVGTYVYNWGYPGSNRQCAASPRADGMCGGFQYGRGGSVEVRSDYHLKYTIDTQPGQSGSPVYTFHNGNRYVVGVHAYGANSNDQNRNKAVRIRDNVANNIKAWKNAWPSNFD